MKFGVLITTRKQTDAITAVFLSSMVDKHRQIRQLSRAAFNQIPRHATTAALAINMFEEEEEEGAFVLTPFSYCSYCSVVSPTCSRHQT